MVLSFALYASLVALGNLTDYDANFFFVTHVLTMDTIFPGSRSLWRAVAAPGIHHAAYGLIIVTEIAVAILCWIGGLRMFRRVKQPLAFNQAKAMAILGLTLGFLLWFTGFMAIGGEWFLMWQSEVANGQQAAFRLVVIILMLLVYLAQPDEEKRV